MSTKGEIRWNELPFKVVYIPLLEDESFEWRWEMADVHSVDNMWTKGWSIYRIAHELNRDPDEVLMLLMDRLRKNKIQDRSGGLAGTV